MFLHYITYHGRWLIGILPKGKLFSFAFILSIFYETFLQFSSTTCLVEKQLFRHMLKCQTYVCVLVKKYSNCLQMNQPEHVNSWVVLQLEIRCMTQLLATLVPADRLTLWLWLKYWLDCHELWLIKLCSVLCFVTKYHCVQCRDLNQNAKQLLTIAGTKVVYLSTKLLQWVTPKSTGSRNSMSNKHRVYCVSLINEQILWGLKPLNNLFGILRHTGSSSACSILESTIQVCSSEAA